MMASHSHEPTRYYRAFGTYEPVLHIAPGDSVFTRTVDAAGADATGQQVTTSGNPLVGPFFIEGAEPGDTLVVHLNALSPNRDQGYTHAPLAENVVDPPDVRQLPPRVDVMWHIDRERRVATTELGNTARLLAVPLAPMLGCIGVAPYREQAIASTTSAQHGGNMDYRGYCVGTTAYFPVFVRGALLFVGDGHAVQGDGEIVGTGVEISFDVQFTAGLLKGKTIQWPRGENAEHIFAVGNARPLDQALQHATTEMLRWLQADYGLDALAASTLLGQCVEYDIGNAYDPAYTVVCKVRKSFLG
jgi:amidase